MTIGGALSELNNLLKADNIPIYYKPSIKAVMDTIVLSNSENSNKWIPVSERLPEDHKDVLIYLSSDQICIGCYNRHRLPFLDKPIGWGADASHDWSSDDVVAWMPLPQPYKGESEGKE